MLGIYHPLFFINLDGLIVDVLEDISLHTSTPQMFAPTQRFLPPCKRKKGAVHFETLSPAVVPHPVVWDCKESIASQKNPSSRSVPHHVQLYFVFHHKIFMFGPNTVCTTLYRNFEVRYKKS